MSNEIAVFMGEVSTFRRSYTSHRKKKFHIFYKTRQSIHVYTRDFTWNFPTAGWMYSTLSPRFLTLNCSIQCEDASRLGSLANSSRHFPRTVVFSSSGLDYLALKMKAFRSFEMLATANLSTAPRCRRCCVFSNTDTRTLFPPWISSFPSQY
jgi:hypothetical protein